MTATVEALAARGQAGSNRRDRSTFARIVRSWYLYLLLVPSFVLLILFVYWPAVQALVESFFYWNPPLENSFVGLRNYQRILADSTWWIAWRNMLFIIIWHFSIPFVMPFVVAELIFNLRNRAMQSFYRTAVLVPTLVPGIVTLMLWRWMYQQDGGVNLILNALGFDSLARLWLGLPQTALPALLFMGFPWATGASVLIYLAGLSNISKDIMDAATIDGCSRIRRVFEIDIPNIMGVVRLFLILGIIDVFQEFGPMLAITRGGPFFATYTPGLYLYARAWGLDRFDEPRLGEACAVGAMLFVLILIFSLIGNRYLRNNTEVEGIKA